MGSYLDPIHQSLKMTFLCFLLLIYDFVCIACILGTGILGLPVTLHKSGFYPYLITFLITYLLQCYVAYLFVEILQRACILQLLTYKKSLDAELSDFVKEDHKDTDVILGDGLSEDFSPDPNLHQLGEMFLYFGVRHFYDLMVILQLVSILIGYCIAASESYSVLLHIKRVYVMITFVIILSSIIIHAIHFIQPIISILTFFKGSAFSLTVIVTCILGFKIHETGINDFSYTGDSFLMGTVALGGTINVMPFLYKDIPQNKREIRKFLFAVLAAITTCVVLNIAWCWSVLNIVPQLDLCSYRDLIPDYLRNDSSKLTLEYCDSYISLQMAEGNGEISTTPLVKLIEQSHSQFSWISTLIQIFIIISISVSFLTLGTALQDITNGIILTTFFQQKDNGSISPKYNEKCGKTLVSKIINSILFVIILIIALVSLKNFVTILEKITSFSLNTQNVIVFFMYIQSRKLSDTEIPLPVPKCLHIFSLLVLLYFGFAVIYDVCVTILPESESLPSHNETLQHLFHS